MFDGKITVVDKGVQDLLQALQSKTQNRRPLMRLIAGDMRDAVEKNFQAEGRPQRWLNLSSKTIAQRTKKGTWPGKILQVSGKLAKVSSSSDNDRAIAGSNLPQAAAQQFGVNKMVSVRAHMSRVKSRDVFATTKRGGKGRKIASGVSASGVHSRYMRIPARPFLSLTEGDIEGIKMRISDYLLKKA